VSNFFNIFIYCSSLYVSAIHVPIIRENCWIFGKRIFITLYGWRLVCCLDWNATGRPDATHTEWQIPVSHRYSNFLLKLGTWMPETCGEKKLINILNIIVQRVGFVHEDYTGMNSKKHKFLDEVNSSLRRQNKSKGESCLCPRCESL